MPDRGGPRPSRGPRLRTGLPGTGRGLLLRTVLACFLVCAVVTVGANARADRLWYRTVGHPAVWNTVFSTRASLFAVFGLLAALTVGGNVWLAYRLRPPLSAMSEEQQSLERYRGAIGRHRAGALASAALLPGLAAGATASGAWETWLAFDHSTSFGSRDPQFHLDVSFYVFRLPWYRFLVGFGFTVLVVTLAVTALVHYLYGNIQAQSGRRRFTSAARGQLGVLLGLFVALKAVSYWLDRYALAVKGGSLGTADGWTGLRFADADAVLPAKTVLCCAAAICALLFLLTPLRPLRRSWTVPMVGLGLLGLSSLLVCVVYPAIVQQFQVRPHEGAKERPFIQRNITATRAAFNIAGARTAAYGSAQTPSGDAMTTDAAVLNGLRLTAPGSVPEASAAVAAQQRVKAVAPWLRTDRSPYRVTVDGRELWVVDGYTTSDSYPYASRTTLGAGGAGEAGRVNYVRDAVKATVDGTTGAVLLYQWDRADPVLSTWMKAFPGTVRPYAAIDAALMSQLRYPEDLFTAQQRMLATYHVTDPAAFYRGGDVWTVPADPTDGGDGPESPYYLSLRMPDQTAVTAALAGTFVAAGRDGGQELAAYMAVDSTPGPGYGTIRLLVLPAGGTRGPAQVQAAFMLKSSAAATGQPGVEFGDLLALPVGGGVLYAEGVYSRGASGRSALPQQVLVAFGSRTVTAADLPTALAEVFGGTPGLTSEVQAVQQAYQDWMAAVARGDAGATRQDRDQLRAALNAALAATGTR